mmetsp:Transcript_11881/g.34318  ORF Transcript_11881/g.34318 Transcript_11881/m.34318 type:complete len:341 (-) Transcript_11881:6-1028(-)
MKSRPFASDVLLALGGTVAGVSPARAAQIQRQFFEAAAAWLPSSSGVAAEEPGSGSTKKMNVGEIVRAIAKAEDLDPKLPKADILETVAKSYKIDLAGLLPFEQARTIAKALELPTTTSFDSPPSPPSGGGEEAAVSPSPPPLQLTQERVVELASTTLCNWERHGSLATLAHTVAGASPPPEQPEYMNMVQREQIFVEQGKKIEVAAGKVVNAVITLVTAAINAQIGNVPGLMTFANRFLNLLRETTFTVASSSTSEQQAQSQVMLDPESQTLFLFRLHKERDSSSIKFPVFSQSKFKVQIKCYFAMVQAANDTAMDKLKQVEREKANEILGTMGKLEVF